MWRRRGARDAVCTWCERPPAEVAKLIAGPKVYICDDCVQAAERTITGKHARAGLTRVEGRGRKRCSFCRKKAASDRPLVAGPANVCADCLRVCREILDSTAA